MPLSNEFSDSRLSYLQDAIKNTEIVSQQFYPRFVREYNEQFPFTEQRVSNVLNPTANSAIKGYLKPNIDTFEDDLLLKLNSITNDESISRYIVDDLKTSLSPAQLSYYNDNFNTIQKKVRIPYGGISKESFVEQILMALANDNHKNDVSIFNNSYTSNQLSNPSNKLIFDDSILQTPILRRTIFDSPTKSTSSFFKENKLNDEIKLPIKTRGRPPGSKNKKGINKKGINAELVDQPNVFGIPLINDEDIYPADNEDNLERGRIIRMKTPSINEIYKDNTGADDIISDFLRGKSKNPRIMSNHSVNDMILPPLPIKRVRIKKKQNGNGINPLKPLILKDRIIKHKKVFNNKYAIDTKKLKNNILDLKYLKNANHVATFQPIEISSYLKNIIENIIKDNYNIQKEEFIHLNNTEKRILKRLFYFLKIKNDDVMDYDYNIQKRFEVAYGSFLAGNTNKELIQELKDYVKLALHESTINKTDGQLILKKLNNNK
jgi:hypothetical protein